MSKKWKLTIYWKQCSLHCIVLCFTKKCTCFSLSQLKSYYRQKIDLHVLFYVLQISLHVICNISLSNGPFAIVFCHLIPIHVTDSRLYSWQVQPVKRAVSANNLQHDLLTPITINAMAHTKGIYLYLHEIKAYRLHVVLFKPTLFCACVTSIKQISCPFGKWNIQSWTIVLKPRSRKSLSGLRRHHRDSVRSWGLH